MTIKLSIAPLMALGFSRSDIAALQALVSRSGGVGDTVVTSADNQMQFEEYAVTPLEAIEALRGVDELRNAVQQQDPMVRELVRAVDELRNEMAGIRPAPAPVAYQEGVWTPAIAFGGASVGMTYSVQTGAFTRIGNRIFFSARATLTSKGSSVGAATITSLPFASANVVSQANATALFVNNVAATVVPPNANIAPNSAILGMNQLVAGVNTALADTDFTNTTVVTVSGHYAI